MEVTATSTQNFRKKMHSDIPDAVSLDRSSQDVDKCHVKVWQQSHYLMDSGIHTAMGTSTPSLNGKVGPDDGDGDERFVNPRVSFTHWSSFPMSVNQPDSSLLSPATPSTGSVVGLDTLGDTLSGSHSIGNVDFRGNKLPEVDTDEAASAIPELVKLIKDEDDPVIIYQSSMMVFQLSKSEAIDALIKSMDMIDCIISALSRTDDPETVRFLSGTLYNMSQTQLGLKAIFAAHVVPCLVNLLNSPIESVLFYAITTLHNLLLHQDGAKNVVRQSGCLQKMTLLLRKNNIKFLTICTDCLQILAYGHQESKLQILSSGGPSELVRILRLYQYEKLLWTTARVLKVLSVCTSNKPAIIAAGGMDALAKHLHSSSHRLVINCLWALRNLSDAATRLDNLHSLLHSLVQLLDCGDSNVVTCAAGILSNLTCNNHTNKFIVHKLGGIPGLLRAVGQVAVKEDILEPCVCALRHLTSRHEEEETARYAIVHELGGLPLLSRILHAATAGICPDLDLVCQPPQIHVSSWTLIKAMVGLLRNLSVNIDSHYEMREYGLVSGLFLLLHATQYEISKRSSNSSSTTQPFATMVQNVRLEEIVEGICGALHMLAKDHATRSYLALLKSPNLVIFPRVQPGCCGLTIFVHLLHSSHESIQRAAAGVLAELSQDRDGLEALVNIPGASNRFTELVQSRNEAISTYASAVIIRMSEERKGVIPSGQCALGPQPDLLHTPPLSSDVMRSYQPPSIHSHPQPQSSCCMLVPTSNAQTSLPNPAWAHQFTQELINPIASPPPNSLTEMLGPPPAAYKGPACPSMCSYWTNDCSFACPNDATYIYPENCESVYCCSPPGMSYLTPHVNSRMDVSGSPPCSQSAGLTYASLSPHPNLGTVAVPNHYSLSAVSNSNTFTALVATSGRRSGYGSVESSGYISPSNELYMQPPSFGSKLQQLSSSGLRQSRVSTGSYPLPPPHSKMCAIPPASVSTSQAHSAGYLSPELMSLDEETSNWLTGTEAL